jgi:hypothetical protein
VTLLLKRVCDDGAVGFTHSPMSPASVVHVTVGMDHPKLRSAQQGSVDLLGTEFAFAVVFV